MAVRKYTLFALLFTSSTVLADESFHFGLDAVTGVSSYSVSSCRGDCEILQDDPDNDFHIGIGASIEKRFSNFGLGAVVRVFDGNNDDSLSRVIDAFVRLSYKNDIASPYIGFGVSKQKYKSRLSSEDGPDLSETINTPVYVLGVEKRTSWGYWYAEFSRTDDSIEADSHINTGTPPSVPVEVDFDIERKTLIVGVSFDLN